LASLQNATPVEAIEMNARLNPKIGRRGILGLAAVAVAASAALRERDRGGLALQTELVCGVETR
jgi:hypothetical protein